MNRLLIVLAGGTFAVGTAGFVTAGILPQVSGSFGISVAAAGQLVTVFAIAYAVGAPVLAAVTGRWPRRVLLAASLAVFVAGGVATALAPTFGLALGGWVVTAAGGAMFVPTASARDAPCTTRASCGLASLARSFGALHHPPLRGVQGRGVALRRDLGEEPAFQQARPGGLRVIAAVEVYGRVLRHHPQ